MNVFPYAHNLLLGVSSGPRRTTVLPRLSGPFKEIISFSFFFPLLQSVSINSLARGLLGLGIWGRRVPRLICCFLLFHVLLDASLLRGPCPSGGISLTSWTCIDGMLFSTVFKDYKVEDKMHKIYCMWVVTSANPVACGVIWESFLGTLSNVFLKTKILSQKTKIHPTITLEH